MITYKLIDQTLDREWTFEAADADHALGMSFALCMLSWDPKNRAHATITSIGRATHGGDLRISAVYDGTYQTYHLDVVVGDTTRPGA